MNFPMVWTELSLFEGDNRNQIKIYHEYDVIALEVKTNNNKQIFYLNIEEANELVNLLNYKINQMKQYKNNE